MDPPYKDLGAAKGFSHPRAIPEAMAVPPDLVHRTRLLAKTVLAGAVVLVALLLALFVVVNHASLPEPIILFWGLFILILGLIAGIAAAYLFLARAQATSAPAAATSDGTRPVAPPDLENLAVRLLDGDERRLMRVIVEAKGEILQRDLVRITAFSDAKVSRLLDRLEERGLVVRERHGMSNRVRLTLHET